MGKRAFYLDGLIFIPTILLVSLGLITLLSIDAELFYQQILFVVVGIILFFLFSKIDFQLYRYLDKIFYVSIIILLLLSHLSPTVRGATRWIQFGNIRIQPSEIIKPFFLLSMASFLVKYPPIKFKHVILHLSLFIVIFLIILRQPDLGNAVIFSAIWLVLIVMSGIPLRYITVSSAIFIILLPIFYRFLHSYQKLRLLIFINPLTDPRGAGYNAIQSLISVGSGKLFGRGFGRGTQSLLKFLPERHTDFIFASFTEEFGFLGSAFLLGIFFILLMRMLQHITHRAPNQYCLLFLVGFFMQLFTHVIINVGMNMGLVPITGITLPLVSYGGSSIIGTFIALGIYMSAIQDSHYSE